MTSMPEPEPCPICSSSIAPAMAGHPGTLTIPWHQDPGAPGKPCPASQSPFKGLNRLQAQAKADGGLKAQAAIGLIYKASPRRFLTAPSPDENILLWLDLVEKQTGKPFILEGDAFCIIEEVGEYAEGRDLAEVEDALCDSYVATLVGDELLKRQGWSGIQPKLVPGGEARSCLENLSVFTGRLANYCRKPRTEERARRVVESSFTAKLAIKRELAGLGLSFEKSIEKVLDTLDKRLQDGYQMNAAGSAIKKADQ